MSGEPPQAELPISFALLLNLASASNSEDREVLWGFIRRYEPDATPEAHPLLDQLVGYAIRYFHDFVKPSKVYRAPSEKERAALLDLDARLGKLPKAVLAEEIQGRGLRGRQGARLRAAARLVRRALRGAARPDAGAALRLLRRALRHRGDPSPDRQGFAGRARDRGLSEATARTSMTFHPFGMSVAGNISCQSSVAVRGLKLGP